MAEAKAFTAEELAEFANGYKQPNDDILRFLAAIKERDARIAELEAERVEAMTVLAPSMPQSGLVDACRQVKQAAISNADTAEKAMARVAELERYV